MSKILAKTILPEQPHPLNRRNQKCTVTNEPNESPIHTKLDQTHPLLS